MTDLDYEDDPAPWWRHAAQRWALAVLDWCEYRAGRVLCRLFDRHGKSCRGRRDHLAQGGIVRAALGGEAEGDREFVLPLNCPARCGHLHSPLSVGTGGRCPFCSCQWRSTR